MAINISTNATTPIQEISELYEIGKLTVLFSLSAVIIAGNILTIIAVASRKNLRRSATNMLVMNLAVADGLVGCLLIAFSAVSDISKDERVWRRSVCAARAPYYSIIVISACTLLAIAVDRYLAIVRPFSYKRHVTAGRARFISGLMWIFELVIVGTTTCYYGNVAPIERIRSGHISELLPTAIFASVILPQVCIPLLGNFILYWRIFATIRNRRRVAVACHDKQVSSVCLASRMSTAVTKMMSVVLAYLVLTWLPYFVLLPFTTYYQTNPLWLIYGMDLATVLVYTNSAVNPLIYGWLNREFRAAYVAILMCGKLRSSPPVEEACRA
ncbi:hypothetical protein LSH36_171g08003 [Paralvinella palmiformis]|uniref:G-protein coupled receptors family 1 profile domain-containing protein n=1 Tax=Paralvinella palmiformis TaxID=53620 RepID=A0AAD9JSY2_9ANNE|nr:hypothetical protein LSH36_171g08003 [Paralvinella palmiformis]